MLCFCPVLSNESTIQESVGATTVIPPEQDEVFSRLTMGWGHGSSGHHRLDPNSGEPRQEQVPKKNLYLSRRKVLKPAAIRLAEQKVKLQP